EPPVLPARLGARALLGADLASRVSFVVPVAGKHVVLDDWESATEEAHRRQGLYTALLVYAEIVTGRVVRDDPGDRSPEAQKVWDQPGRPFGNAEPAAEPNPEADVDQ